MPRISQVELRTLRQRANLVHIIGRHVKLQQNGGDWFGLCPFHEEKTPSFSVNPSKGFFHCFGCNAHGDVFDWLVRIERVDFPSAVKRLQAEVGNMPVVTSQASSETSQRDDSVRRIALKIWEESSLIGGTLGETYLRSARKISIELPVSLKFHPALKEEPGPNGKRRAALVAGISNPDGQIVAIQRTFLRPDGLGKASIDRAKRALGARGNGAVRLAPSAKAMGIAEGVETGLSAIELYSLPVWCALGSSLSKVWLPSVAKQIIIFADRGVAGVKAAEEAVREFHAQGRKAVVRFPEIGDDFNDELKARRHG
jgi:DNA primase